MVNLVGETPMTISINTADICLEDLALGGDQANEAMLRIGEQITAAVKVLRTLQTDNIRVDWRIIQNRTCSVDGTIGFFQVNGNLP